MCGERKRDRRGRAALPGQESGRKGGAVSLEGADGPVLNPGPRSFRNVVFDIAPGGEVGTFDVHATFLGVDMEHFRLHYQVRGHPRPRGRA